jgi:hypothetical protein
LLWANSGNRCALCSRPLSHAADSVDSAAVVGDECHIISSAAGGPRHDPFFTDDSDGYDNLLLLCATDHRRVDAQVGTFSVEKLKQLKANHESTVARAMDSVLRSPTPSADEGFDNYRTEVVFTSGQSEGDFERFQQVIIHDHRLRAYGRVGTGFHGPTGRRSYSWIQSFLPISEELLHTFASDARVSLTAIRHIRLPGVYKGLIP